MRQLWPELRVVDENVMTNRATLCVRARHGPVIVYSLHVGGSIDTKIRRYWRYVCLFNNTIKVVKYDQSKG